MVCLAPQPERAGSERAHYWAPRYIDDAVGRRVDRDGDGTFTASAADNFYYLTDVMFSNRAITDSSGLLHTRVDYTPYGVAMHGKAADVDGSGTVNSADYLTFLINYNEGDALQPGDTGYDPDADLSGSGSMGTFELYAFLGLYNARKG